MSFTATPVDGSATPIPMSSAVPDGTNTPLAIEGGPSITTGGNTLVPVSMYVKDGNDVTLGTSTDANTINSVMGRLTKIRDLLNATLTVGGTVTANAGTGNFNNASVGTDGSAIPASSTQMGGSDGVNLRQIAVTQAHNADNQTPAASGYGILANSNAAILNAAGTVDRARGIGFDAIPAVGVPAGGQQLAGPALSTTFNGAVTGSTSAQSVVVVSSANAKVGDIIVTQDNVEYVEITAIADATHVTGIFKNNHASGQSLTWYHYNQARDATIGDALSNLAGVSPSATYLWNNVNSTMEYDRSANGERDGASGQGTAVAAEYEYNANPLANGSVFSNLQFDRARNVQAGGLGSGTISNNPLAANSTTLTLNAAPTTLDKGMQIILDRAGANPETNYVATSYTPGSTSVPLQIATQFSHAQNATVEWGQHAPLGPQLNGFLPSGLGMEEEIVYDPVSKKYYVEISATADANSGQNILGESEMLWNGSTFDRARSVSIGDGAAATGIGADGIMLYNGATFDRLKGTGGAANIIPQATTGSAVPANAFYLGGDAATALPTAATAGNLTGAMVDKFGRIVVVPETVRDLKSNIPGLTLTSTTETTLIAAVAATFNDITGIICENTSATAVRVDFRDSTGGTIQFSLYLPAGDTRGFSNMFYKQTTINNNWTAQLSAAVTDVRIYGTYVANK